MEAKNNTAALEKQVTELQTEVEQTEKKLVMEQQAGQAIQAEAVELRGELSSAKDDLSTAGSQLEQEQVNLQPPPDQSRPDVSKH